MPVDDDLTDSKEATPMLPVAAAALSGFYYRITAPLTSLLHPDFLNRYVRAHISAVSTASTSTDGDAASSSMDTETKTTPIATPPPAKRHQPSSSLSKAERKKKKKRASQKKKSSFQLASSYFWGISAKARSDSANTVTFYPNG